MYSEKSFLSRTLHMSRGGNNENGVNSHGNLTLKSRQIQLNVAHAVKFVEETLHKEKINDVSILFYFIVLIPVLRK